MIKRDNSFSVKSFAFIISLFALPFAACAADLLSGNHIVNGCADINKTGQGTANKDEFFECAGAVITAWQMMKYHHEFCPPKNATTGQAMRVVSKYMNDNPALLNQSYPTLIFNALRMAWPCTDDRQESSSGKAPE